MGVVTMADARIPSSKRLEREVNRAIAFVMPDIRKALAFYQANPAKREADIIVIFVANDPVSLAIYEEFAAAGPGLPPTIEANSVTVAGVPWERFVDIICRWYPSLVPLAPTPLAADDIRLAVLVEGTVHIQIRALYMSEHRNDLEGEELSEHLIWLKTAMNRQVVKALRRLHDQGASSGRVAALFHGADKQALKLYRRMEGPNARDLPKIACWVSLYPVDLLAPSARELGYSVTDEELSHVPGKVRLVLFTLERVFVQTIDVVSISSRGGTA
jgi:hypothetical protein